MSQADQKYVAFACFYRDPSDEGKIKALRVHGSLAEVKDWAEKDQASRDNSDASSEPDKDSISEDAEEKKLFEPTDRLSALVDKFYASIFSFDPLIFMGESVLPIIRNGILEQEVNSEAKAKFDQIEEIENYTIYGVTDEKYFILNHYLKKVRELDRGSNVLPGAILLSIVATFDSFIAELVEIMLRARSKK